MRVSGAMTRRLRRESAPSAVGVKILWVTPCSQAPDYCSDKLMSRWLPLLMIMEPGGQCFIHRLLHCLLHLGRIGRLLVVEQHVERSGHRAHESAGQRRRPHLVERLRERLGKVLGDLPLG